jgi:ribose 5-phosphate isomerase A
VNSSTLDREGLKRQAATGAMDWIEANYDTTRELRLGMGSGSTVTYSFPRFAEYPHLTAVPSSEKTEKRLVELGIEVDELKETDRLLFDLDGADEVDPELNLIKGGGGCHYREKKVAKRSKRLFIVVDQTKLVDYLGQTFPLPVEVYPESKGETRELLSRYGDVHIRSEDGEIFRTDSGNVIFDLDLGENLKENDPGDLEKELNEVDGVVENGLFARRKADVVFVGTEDGLEVIGDESL